MRSWLRLSGVALPAPPRNPPSTSDAMPRQGGEGRAEAFVRFDELYEPTFSRTVWRLYGGARGLVMGRAPSPRRPGPRPRRTRPRCPRAQRSAPTPRHPSHSGRQARKTKIVQGWPKLRANFRALIGISHPFHSFIVYCLLSTLCIAIDNVFID
jgi:hypothetical protein